MRVLSVFMLSICVALFTSACGGSKEAKQDKQDRSISKSNKARGEAYALLCDKLEEKLDEMGLEKGLTEDGRFIATTSIDKDRLKKYKFSKTDGRFYLMSKAFLHLMVFLDIAFESSNSDVLTHNIFCNDFAEGIYHAGRITELKMGRFMISTAMTRLQLENIKEKSPKSGLTEKDGVDVTSLVVSYRKNSIFSYLEQKEKNPVFFKHKSLRSDKDLIALLVKHGMPCEKILSMEDEEGNMAVAYSFGISKKK